jgi:hypothetical protein
MSIRCLILVAVALAQTVSPVSDTPKFKYVLPDGFRGWACIDFGVPDAPALTQDARGYYVIEAVTDVIVKTSSFPGLTATPYASEIAQVIDGQPRVIEPRQSQIRFDSPGTGPISRSCLFIGHYDGRSVQRPPTLRESAMGTSPILNEFEFVQGSLCDLRQVTSVCIDARDVRQRNIGRTIASALGMPATLKSNCYDKVGVAVRYEADWGVITHSKARGIPMPIAQIHRLSGPKGQPAFAIWTDPEEESAEAGATRFGRELAELFRKAAAATCVK